MKATPTVPVALLLVLLCTSRMVLAEGVELPGPRNSNPPSDRSRTGGPGPDFRPGPGNGSTPHESPEKRPSAGRGPNLGPGGDPAQDRGPERDAGPSRRPEPSRFESADWNHSRQKHLRRAVQHLHAAGIHEMADQLERMSQGGDWRRRPDGRDEGHGVGLREGMGAPRLSGRPQGSGPVPGEEGGHGRAPQPQRAPGDQPRPEARNGGGPSEGRGPRPEERVDAERLRRELGELRQQLQKLERELDRVNQPPR